MAKKVLVAVETQHVTDHCCPRISGMHILLSSSIRCDEGTAWCVLVLVGGVCNACQTAGQQAEIDRAHDERYSAVSR